jgi:hypothetical protein
MKKACLLLLLIATPVNANEWRVVDGIWQWGSFTAPSEPAVSERDRALGIAKLKEAYKISGDKMCCGFVGTEQVPCYEIKGASGQSFFECAQPGEELKPTTSDAKKITTERVMPVVDPKQKNPLDAIADTTNPDPVKKKKEKHK